MRHSAFRVRTTTIKFIGFLAFTAVGIYTFHFPLVARSQEVSPQETWVAALHQCENNGNIPRILDSNDRYSYGPYMYQMGTWLSYGAPFGATRANIYDADLQRTVTLYMLNQGHWRHWYTCSKHVMKRLGPYPIPGEDTS